VKCAQRNGNSSTKPQFIVCPAGESGELRREREGDAWRAVKRTLHSTRNENYVKAKCSCKKKNKKKKQNKNEDEKRENSCGKAIPTKVPPLQERQCKLRSILQWCRVQGGASGVRTMGRECGDNVKLVVHAGNKHHRESRSRSRSRDAKNNSVDH